MKKARNDMDSDRDGLATLGVGLDADTIEDLVNELEDKSKPPRDKKGKKRKIRTSKQRDWQYKLSKQNSMRKMRDRSIENKAGVTNIQS